MRCPFCKTDEDRVIDSRSIGEGSAIRRRRKCLACGKRFTTYERAEVVPIRVIKKDQSRESFKREKVLKGLTRASEKRSISTEQLESIVSKVESRISEEHDSEVSTKLIGEMVIRELREVDHVAYVRFASVYREFKDVEQFLQEVVSLARPEYLARVGESRSGSSLGPSPETARRPVLTAHPDVAPLEDSELESASPESPGNGASRS